MPDEEQSPYASVYANRPVPPPPPPLVPTKDRSREVKPFEMHTGVNQDSKNFYASVRRVQPSVHDRAQGVTDQDHTTRPIADMASDEVESLPKGAPVDSVNSNLIESPGNTLSEQVAVQQSELPFDQVEDTATTVRASSIPIPPPMKVRN